MGAHGSSREIEGAHARSREGNLRVEVVEGAQRFERPARHEDATLVRIGQELEDEAACGGRTLVSRRPRWRSGGGAVEQ